MVGCVVVGMAQKPADRMNGVEATYKNAVARAYNAAALKAEEMPDTSDRCMMNGVDNAAQAALENSELTGRRFDTAHGEVFETVCYLTHRTDKTNAEIAAALERCKFEQY